jgi:hypothetical protein
MPASGRITALDPDSRKRPPASATSGATVLQRFMALLGQKLLRMYERGQPGSGGHARKADFHYPGIGDFP